MIHNPGQYTPTPLCYLTLEYILIQRLLTIVVCLKFFFTYLWILSNALFTVKCAYNVAIHNDVTRFHLHTGAFTSDHDANVPG